MLTISGQGQECQGCSRISDLPLFPCNGCQKHFCYKRDLKCRRCNRLDHWGPNCTCRTTRPLACLRRIFKVCVPKLDLECGEDDSGYADDIDELTSDGSHDLILCSKCELQHEDICRSCGDLMFKHQTPDSFELEMCYGKRLEQIPSIDIPVRLGQGCIGKQCWNCYADLKYSWEKSCIPSALWIGNDLPLYCKRCALTLFSIILQHMKHIKKIGRLICRYAMDYDDLVCTKVKKKKISKKRKATSKKRNDITRSARKYLKPKII